MGFTMSKSVRIFICIFVGVLSGIEMKVYAENSHPHFVYVDEIAQDFAKAIKKEFDIPCEGKGGRMNKDVEEIDVIFSTNRKASLEEARAIEVRAVQKLLQIINSHEKLKPYLREYPFTPERINVQIGFSNEHNDHISDGTITFMSVIRGKIYYRTHDLIEDKLLNILIEPFEEALKIVERSPLQNADLRKHSPFPYEKHVNEVVKNFTKEAKKKWGLVCAKEGGKLDNGIEEFAFKFVSPMKTNIEKARQLEIETTERFLEIVNSDPFLKPYLKEYPFNPRHIRIAIEFKKYDGKYYTDGSVAVVQQTDNRISYLTQLPDEKDLIRLRPIALAEESYEEGKKNIQSHALKLLPKDLKADNQTDYQTQKNDYEKDLERQFNQMRLEYGFYDDKKN